jgi:hypothetical protein
MAHITFTKKASEKLKIDIRDAEVYKESNLDKMDNWIVDTVWNVKRDPWIMFYHKESTFSVFVRPEKYKLDNCVHEFLDLLAALLNKYNLGSKMHYFEELFRSAIFCKHNDRSSTAYMTQNKSSAYFALEHENPAYRVDNLYDLIIDSNDIIRKKFDFKTALEVFIPMVKNCPDK